MEMRFRRTRVWQALWLPLLKKLYKDQPEKLKESFAAGILIFMEEQNVKTDDFDISAISNLKVALMAQGNPLGMLIFALV